MAFAVVGRVNAERAWHHLLVRVSETRAWQEQRHLVAAQLVPKLSELQNAASRGPIGESREVLTVSVPYSLAFDQQDTPWFTADATTANYVGALADR